MIKKVLRVSDLRDAVVGQIEDSTGQIHNVLAITLEVYQAFVSPPEGVDDISHVFDQVRKVCPTLPDTELRLLTLDAAKAILSMSAGGIEAVEKLYPNAVGPASSATSPA